MKKWGQVAMLLVGVIVALWVAVNSVLVSESSPARDEAKQALRSQLDALTAERESEEPPPPQRPKARADAREEEPEPPPDHEERWRNVLEQLDGLFDYEHPTEAYRLWADLRRSPFKPVPWSSSREAVLRGVLGRYDETITELVALTNLGIPPPRTLCHGDDAPFTWHVEFDAVSLLLVASTVEGRTDNLPGAFDDLMAAMTLFGWSFGGSTGSLYPEFDVPAECVLRSGIFTTSELTELDAHLTKRVDRDLFALGMEIHGEAVITRAERPAWKRFRSFEGKVSAFAQETFLRPWYDDAQRKAFEHAGRLAELASLPYYEVRDELATIDEEAEMRWYNTTVYDPARWATESDFINQAQWEVRRDMVRLALALEEYFHEETGYPESLAAVAPAFDSSLPIDVFTGDFYHYCGAEDGFFLYSCGANGIDDGGEGDDVVLRVKRDGS